MSKHFVSCSLISPPIYMGLYYFSRCMHAGGIVTWICFTMILPIRNCDSDHSDNMGWVSLTWFKL